MDRGLGDVRRDVRRAVLDVAGLGAARVGLVRCIAGGAAFRRRELLGEQLLRRVSGGTGRRAGLGSIPAISEEANASAVIGIGTGRDRDWLHAALRGAGVLVPVILVWRSHSASGSGFIGCAFLRRLWCWRRWRALLFYCKAVTGDPLRTPYAVNQAAYGWPLGLPWFHVRDVKLRDIEMQRYYDYEREAHDRNSSVIGELKHSTQKAQTLWRFYFGPALSIPLVMLGAVWRSRRLRFLFLAAGCTIFLTLMQFVSLPHYAAPAAAAMLAILVECMRRLRHVRRNGRPIGLQLVLAAPMIMVAILAVRIGLEKAHLPFTQANNFESWCCVQPGNQNKARILAMLERAGGEHLVIVKPKEQSRRFPAVDLQRGRYRRSPVVWARDLGPEENRALVEYFRGRKVWLVDPN